MIAQCCTPNSGNFRLQPGGRTPWSAAIGTQSCERLRRKLSVTRGHLPYQFEKQRQRPGRAFMLQRTMIR